MSNASRQGYNQAYRRARAAILGPAGNGELDTDPKCHWCPEIATTADHEPPMEVCGYAHLNLVPACAKCNYGRRYRHLKVKPPPPSRAW